MHGDVWVAPYCRGLQALCELTPSGRAGSRVKADGRPRSVPRGIIAGVCLVIIVSMAMTSRPGMARAQPGTDDILEIPVHPKVATIMYLPDAITRARVNPGSSMEVTIVGRTLQVRPDPGVPAGLEALLAVETPTMLLTFRLCVVEHPEDAREELVVVAMQSEQRAEEGAIAGATEPLGSSRLAFSIHVTTALAGVTEVNVPGYTSRKGLRSHRTIGLRVAISPHDAWWAVEGNIGGEWLDAPTVHVKDVENMQQEEWRVSRPWLEAAVGLRAGTGTKWRATAQAGFGLQAHLRQIERTSIAAGVRQPLPSTEGMSYGAVLTLGMGLQRQIGDVSLGLDFQMQQGVPHGVQFREGNPVRGLLSGPRRLNREAWNALLVAGARVLVYGCTRTILISDTTCAGRV
jgi:hypothetical protein